MSEEDFIPFEASSSKSPSRKYRDRNNPEKERINTTLFISSLPYNATSTDLLTHFSFIGPVRHGFVATEKESGKSKGVGYVTYSLKEDAERAVQELNNGEFGDKGRRIKVTWATERPGLKERNNQEPKPVKVARGRDDNVNESNKDPNALRTLVLTGLPKDLTKGVLWKKVRKVDERIELIYPVEGHDETAHLLFPSHNDAFVAIKKLHGHTYKGNLLSCILKKRLDKLGKGEGSGPSHAGRLIIRNLSWDTTEQDLRAAFLPYGPIHSIDLPTLPSKLPPSHDPTKPSPPPRARGFAFIWFLSRGDAEKAIEGVNGTTIATSGGKTKAGKEGRVVAVDWALSKEKWEEAQKQVEYKLNGKDKVDESSGSSSEDSIDQGDSASDEDTDSVEDEDEEDVTEVPAEEGSSVDEQMELDEPVKPQLPAVDVGSTLFIRNLPFEATEEELRTLFRQFGPMRYAKITIDKATGRSRGSGFVCFWKTDSADQAIEEAKKVLEETGANALPLGGKNPFALPTVLTADPSSSLVSRLVLHGRTLDVTRAVTREEAGHMKEDGERARTAADKRNTYLMREGVVFPNSPAGAALPPAELQKRQDAFNARKALLKSNPSLYISKTRLSIRQLPLFVTDRILKRLAIHAIREFDNEVVAGDRQPFTRIEDSDTTVSPAAKAKKRGERITSVIQAKVVRQTEKIDPLLNLGRSRGYGFLEMRTHKDALKVFRWANNNAEVGKLMAEWWLIELADILERAKKALEARRKTSTAAQEKAEGPGESRSSKGKENEESVEELEARVKKLESRVKEGGERDGGMRGGKTLLIEFSVENVQVVRRRGEKIQAARDGTIGNKNAVGAGAKRSAEEAVDTDDEKQAENGENGTSKKKRIQRQTKRQKNTPGEEDARGPNGRAGSKGMQSKPHGDGIQTSRKSENEVEEKRGIEKLGQHLGSLIGRKRRQRMGGK